MSRLKRFERWLYRYLLDKHPLYKGCSSCDYDIPTLAHKVSSELACNFPVDVVYTYVKGGERGHTIKRAIYWDEKYHQDGLSKTRFHDNGELLYSLRALDAYAPWVNKIYLVTDGQKPDNINVHHPKIQLVDHRDIIPHEFLPTFNSHVIEYYLHNIPGLAEHYVYFNDDCFLLREARKEDFFTANGLPYIFLDWTARRMQGYLGRKQTPHSKSFSNTFLHIDAASRNRTVCPEKLALKDPPIASHLAFAQRKSAARFASDYFQDVIAKTSRNKFRTMDDIALYSHALPMLSYAYGMAIPCEVKYIYLNISRADRFAYYQTLMDERSSNALPLFACFNDVGTGSDPLPRRELTDWLDKFFDKRASFELPVEHDPELMESGKKFWGLCEKVLGLDYSRSPHSKHNHHA